MIQILCTCGHERLDHYRDTGVCYGRNRNCPCIQFKFDIKSSIPEQKKVVTKINNSNGKDTINNRK
jgi:hypothetical protein